MIQRLLFAVLLIALATPAIAQLPNNTSNISMFNATNISGLGKILGGPSPIINGLVLLIIVSIFIFISGTGLDMVVSFGIPFIFVLAAGGLLPPFLALIAGGAGFVLFIWGILNTWGASR